MGAATAHLANVDEIKIIDFGGNSNGSASVSKFGQAPIEILNKFAEGLKGTGFDATKLMKFIGITQEGDTKAPEVTTTNDTKTSSKK